MIEEKYIQFFRAKGELFELMKELPMDKEAAIGKIMEQFNKVHTFKELSDIFWEMREAYASKISHATSMCVLEKYSEIETDEIRALKYDIIKTIELTEYQLKAYYPNEELRKKHEKNLLQRVAELLYYLHLLEKTIKKYNRCKLPKAHFIYITNAVQEIRRVSCVYPHTWREIEEKTGETSPIEEYLKQEKERVCGLLRYK